jgi:hypothetical protein
MKDGRIAIQGGHPRLLSSLVQIRIKQLRPPALTLDVSKHLINIVEQADSPATREGSWLDNPHIVHTVDVSL